MDSIKNDEVLIEVIKATKRDVVKKNAPTCRRTTFGI